MTVYVDELRTTNRTGKWRFRQACHMWADTLEELHELARRLQLRLDWFQERKDFPHYDLTANKRELALRGGAQFMPLRRWILKQRELKELL